jgi:spermidine/putrescine transport system permease protein
LTIFIAHSTFNLPFVFLMVMARLDEFDFSIIEAARDLGANERQTLLKITIPICMPGIISGFLTAITISLEDFVITSFVSGPGSSTLPVYIYSAIRFGVSPVINALSVVMILGTVLLTYLLRNFLKYIAAK